MSCTTNKIRLISVSLQYTLIMCRCSNPCGITVSSSGSPPLRSVMSPTWPAGKTLHVDFAVVSDDSIKTQMSDSVILTQVWSEPTIPAWLGSGSGNAWPSQVCLGRKPFTSEETLYHIRQRMNDCFFYEKGTGVAHMQAFKVRASRESFWVKNALRQVHPVIDLDEGSQHVCKPLFDTYNKY